MTDEHRSTHSGRPPDQLHEPMVPGDLEPEEKEEPVMPWFEPYEASFIRRTDKHMDAARRYIELNPPNPGADYYYNKFEGLVVTYDYARSFDTKDTSVIDAIAREIDTPEYHARYVAYLASEEKGDTECAESSTASATTSG